MRQHPVFSAEIIRPLFDEDLVLACATTTSAATATGTRTGSRARRSRSIARAMCVVDSYDAMSFQRPYKARARLPGVPRGAAIAAGRRSSTRPWSTRSSACSSRLERRSLARRAPPAGARRPHRRGVRTPRCEPRGRGSPAYGAIAARPARGARRQPADALPDDAGRLEQALRDRRRRRRRPGRTLAPRRRDLPRRRAAQGPRGRRSPTSTSSSPTSSASGSRAWRRSHDAGGDVVAAVVADLPAIEHRGGQALGTDARRSFASMLQTAAVRLSRAEIDAITDALTGLYNHRYLHERLSEELVALTRAGAAAYGPLLRPRPLQAVQRPQRPQRRRRGAARGRAHHRAARSGASTSRPATAARSSSSC